MCDKILEDAILEYEPEEDTSYFKTLEMKNTASFVKSNDERIKDQVREQLRLTEDNFGIEDYNLKSLNNVIVSNEGLGDFFNKLAKKIKGLFDNKQKFQNTFDEYKDKVNSLNPMEYFSVDVSHITPLQAFAIKHVNDDLFTIFKRISDDLQAEHNKLSITDFSKCFDVALDAVKKTRNQTLTDDLGFRPSWEKDKWFHGKDFSLVGFDANSHNTGWSFIIPEAEEEEDFNTYNVEIELNFRLKDLPSKSKDIKYWHEVMKKLVAKIENNMSKSFALQSKIEEIMKKYTKLSWDTAKSNGIPQKCLRVKTLILIGSLCALESAAATITLDLITLKTICNSLK